MTAKSKDRLIIELARNSIDTFEKIIRKFIEDNLKSHYDENWWEMGIPRPIKELIEQRLTNQRKQEPKRHWKRIEMLTFNDYKGIILRNQNWHNIFQEYFYEKSYVEFPFERLSSKRNDVFHNRKIINKDLKKIDTYTDEIYKYLPNHYTTQISIDLGDYEGKTSTNKGLVEIIKKDDIDIQETFSNDQTFELDEEIEEEIISRKGDWYDIPIIPLIGVVEKIHEGNELVMEDRRTYGEIEYEEIKSPSNKGIITTEGLLTVLSNKDWQPITHLIFKLKIQDMMDARFLQLKLKELKRKGLITAKIIKGKKHWKLK